jgi:hypothetical protein
VASHIRQMFRSVALNVFCGSISQNMPHPSWIEVEAFSENLWV